MFIVKLEDLVNLLNKNTDCAQGSESFLVAHDAIKRQVLDEIDMFTNTLVIEINTKD